MKGGDADCKETGHGGVRDVTIFGKKTEGTAIVEGQKIHSSW
jgi:hypothetical protein